MNREYIARRLELFAPETTIHHMLWHEANLCGADVFVQKLDRLTRRKMPRLSKKMIMDEALRAGVAARDALLLHG